MKKKYIQPTAKLHNVGVHHMLCGSNPNSLTGTLDFGATDSDNSDNNLGKEDFGW